MTLILCLDEKNGMLFGGKRQSRDGALIQRLCGKIGGARLLVTPYSRALFPDEARVIPCDRPETEARKGDFYFVEDGTLPQEGVSRIILYRWNRRYPGTRFFDPALWRLKLLEKEDFAGTSHERITEEIYEVLL
ncbi:MAG: hypothetical protein IKJ74_01975 [Clostridia bacterium]|nr:hypothetical protein [Clostridia bacterium]